MKRYASDRETGSRANDPLPVVKSRKSFRVLTRRVFNFKIILPMIPHALLQACLIGRDSGLQGTVVCVVLVRHDRARFRGDPHA